MAVHLEAFRPDKERLKVHTGPWSAALDRGVGLVIGYGPGVDASRFRYQIQKPPASIFEDLDEEEAEEVRATWACDPINGGGYRITSKQSKMMALALWGLISVEEGNRQDWILLPREIRKSAEESPYRHSYRPPAPKQLIEVWEELAAWMAESGGFRIW